MTDPLTVAMLAASGCAVTGSLAGLAWVWAGHRRLERLGDETLRQIRRDTLAAIRQTSGETPEPGT